MLKSCWDCLAGDGTRAEEPYYNTSVQLNSNGNASRAPPWPTPRLRNEKMFLLPKQLEPLDQIIVSCETADQPGLLRFGLVTESGNAPDYSNIACQVEMYFPPQYSDKLAITTVQNGESTLVYEDSAVGYYEGSIFSITFRMRDNGRMDIRIGASHLRTIQLIHDISSIRFLNVSGDINRVSGIEFQFGGN